ncbi:MAG: hypothetical protein A2046_10565 [Bacteroidetes bacterium GWA2_30_7]|nr:MAG: hypothetical protein A2046_10565 [Bacteroidetes bacterium GWA2_30_7]
MVKLFVTFLLLFSFQIILYSQNKKEIKKQLGDAIKLFNEDRFDEAQKILIELNEVDKDDFEVEYYLGACYLNSENLNTQKKSLPFLEFAIKKNQFMLPPDLFLDLGKLYLKIYDFKKAELMLKKYQQSSIFDEQQQNKLPAYLSYIKNGKKYFKDTMKIKSSMLGNKINTENIESMPFVTADGNNLFFTRIIKKKNTKIDSLKIVLKSTKLLDEWQEPENLFFEGYAPGEVDVQGISSDGNAVVFKFRNSLNMCIVNNEMCVDSRQIDILKSDEIVSGVTISSDNKEIIYSSNKTGGTGGFDLYQTFLVDEVNWAKPKNMGTKINTKSNETYPFLFPDQKTLYFSSDGYFSIGGIDICKTSTIDGKTWIKAANAGYPINSYDNDFLLSITANNKYGYISRTSSDDIDDKNIFELVFPDSKPYITYSGKIINGITNQPAIATINVIITESGVNKTIKTIENNNFIGNFMLSLPLIDGIILEIISSGFYPQKIALSPEKYDKFETIMLTNPN